MSAAHQKKIIAALRLPPPNGATAWTTAALAKNVDLPRIIVQAAIDALRSVNKVKRGSIELSPSMIEAPAPAPPPAPPPPPPPSPPIARKPAAAKAKPVRPKPPLANGAAIQAAMLEDPQDGFAFLRRRWPDLLARIIDLGRDTGAGPAGMMVAVIEAGLQAQEGSPR